jgi:hypothetical protein
MNRQAWRQWLVRLLLSAGISTLLVIVSAVLQAVLSMAGDAAAASAVNGVLLVSATVLGLTLAGVVVVLAIIELTGDS